ncbi:hypothetical protein ACOCJ7_10645 [Knoellia sp. CPCC 206453]|uniref:hypothetical protein n=1 Tax=Knoellia pratensis TaxID=3404796 RepID=UPI00360B23E1
MSDTTKNTGADGIPEGSGTQGQGEIREEVRLDLDEESIEKWDAVRDDYAVDTDADVSRPALTESEDDDENDLTLASEDDEEDDEAEDEDQGSPGDEEE